MGFRRARRDRWIFGVCGGFAHQYGYRPWVVRLVVAAIIVLIPGFNVIPILAYVLLGFLLPESDLY